jgi:5-methylcytosine-specific restriction endonuclease McrA
MSTSSTPVRAVDIPATIGSEPGKAWTDAVFRSLLRGALRRIWFRYPGRLEVLKSARVEILTRKKDGTGYKKNVWHRCSVCDVLGKSQLSPKNLAELKRAKKAGEPRPETIPLRMAIDHIDPLVPLDGSAVTWQEYVMRLFCPPENLRVLCSNCHSVVTKEGNALRRANAKVKRSP